MTNEVERNTSKLKEKILTLRESEEFLRLSELVENDKNLIAMRNEISRLDSEGKVKERDELLAKYNETPLVSNLNIAREEVIQLLKEIAKEIM